MRTVLFITYYYPPSVDAGAKRAEGLARYLPDHGYTPVVLTVRNGNYQTAGGEPVPDAPGIVRVAERTFLPSRGRLGASQALPRAVSPPMRWLRSLYRELFHQPDAYWGFHRPALERAMQIVQSQHIDAILTSSGPFTLLRTGHALRARTGLPWVADLRDLWVNSHLGYPHSPLRRMLDARLERRWLSSASYITTVTKGFVDVLRATGYGHLPIECVPNGYFDPPADEPVAPPGCDVLRLCFTGTLHERAGNIAAPLLEALRRLGGPSVAQADFYGAVNTDFAMQAASLGLEGAVRYRGRVTREDAQRRQQAADVLLVLQADTPEVRANLSSKTFDYLVAKRAILAIGPLAGENAALLRKVGVTHIFAPHDVEGIARSLADMAEMKRRLGWVPCEVDPQAVGAFHYRNLAGRMARVLDAAVGSR